jgi:hypothetical protein
MIVARFPGGEHPEERFAKPGHRLQEEDDEYLILKD